MPEKSHIQNPNARKSKIIFENPATVGIRRGGRTSVFPKRSFQISDDLKFVDNYRGYAEGGTGHASTGHAKYPRGDCRPRQSSAAIIIVAIQNVLLALLYLCSP